MKIPHLNIPDNPLPSSSGGRGPTLAEQDRSRGQLPRSGSPPAPSPLPLGPRINLGRAPGPMNLGPGLARVKY
jgi:hypothetical protein